MRPFRKSPSLPPRGESKRGEASLIQPFPLPLTKGKGIKGIGLLKIKGEGLINNLSLSNLSQLAIIKEIYLGLW